MFKTKDGLKKEVQFESAMNLRRLTNDPPQSYTRIKNDHLMNLRIIQSHSLITVTKQSHHKDSILLLQYKETVTFIQQNFCLWISMLKLLPCLYAI